MMTSRTSQELLIIELQLECQNYLYRNKIKKVILITIKSLKVFITIKNKRHRQTQIKGFFISL